ncbi:MAG: hypothetical protein HY741_12635 [Chloroflexi bacterium]|nr:hypothetical protein [Chloroflexota bacterium]
MNFKIKLSTDVSQNSRDELVNTLKQDAQVQATRAQAKDLGWAEMLFVVAAGVQTIDILWNWFQAARAKNKRVDAVVETDDGREIHLQDVTLDELKRLLDF